MTPTAATPSKPKPKRFPTLGITSPYTKGERVETAQRKLRNNPYGNFLPHGKIDGEFGPLTGAACHRAKHWLGYPASRCTKTYGHTLHRYLTGDAKLSPVMRWRRKRRKAKAAKKNRNAVMRRRLVEAAAKYNGVEESPPNSNNVKFSRWYGMIGAWCAMFISYLLAVHLGVKFWRYAYCPYILADAFAKKSRMYVIHPDAAEPGDIFVVDWSGGEVDHTGILRSAIRSGRFKTWEGNTAVGNNSNGGKVMPRDREINDARRWYFIRINFS